MRDTQPFEFVTPRTLAPGPHQVEVRIFDDRNQYGSTTIEVEQAGCEERNDCDFAFVCVDRLCVLGPGNAAGIGASCDGSEGCQSGLCAVDHGELGVCAAACESDPNSCPFDFHCITAQGGRKLCIPDNAGPGGFCSTGGGRNGSAFLLLLVALFFSNRRCGTRESNGEPRH